MSKIGPIINVMKAATRIAEAVCGTSIPQFLTYMVYFELFNQKFTYLYREDN